MNQITNEALDFLKEAKEVLSKNQDLFTYRDKEANYIALRTGMFDDCIMIYELGNEVGNFTEQLPRQRKSLIDSDDLLKYQKVLDFLETVDDWMILGSEDFRNGYKFAIEHIKNHLK